MDKKELRREIRRRKAQYTAEELVAMSQEAQKRLAKQICDDNNIKTVLLYNSLPDEVCTTWLIKELAEKGKRVLLPTVVGDDLELHEYAGDALSHSGYMNITESDGPLFTDFDSIDFAVIPGMAFTKDGVRLGRGKGYYDRLLPKTNCPLAGLAFDFQIVDAIPSEQHDVRMDFIVQASS